MIADHESPWPSPTAVLTPETHSTHTPPVNTLHIDTLHIDTQPKGNPDHEL